MKALFLFKANNGQPDFGSEYNQSRFNQLLKDRNGEIFAIVPQSKVVTDTMRGYVFGALVPFLRQVTPKSWTGLTDEQIYDVLKKNFNYFEAINPLTKRIERYGQSVMSKNCENQKAKEFISRIDDWLQENYNQSVPDAEEYKRFVRDNPQLISQ